MEEICGYVWIVCKGNIEMNYMETKESILAFDVKDNLGALGNCEKFIELTFSDIERPEGFPL